MCELIASLPSRCRTPGICPSHPANIRSSRRSRGPRARVREGAGTWSLFARVMTFMPQRLGNVNVARRARWGPERRQNDESVTSAATSRSGLRTLDGLGSELDSILKQCDLWHATRFSSQKPVYISVKRQIAIPVVKIIRQQTNQSIIEKGCNSK